MQLDEPERPQLMLKPTDIVYVKYRGNSIPMKANEVGIFHAMNREEKNELLKTFKRITKKGIVVKGRRGYVKRNNN